MFVVTFKDKCTIRYIADEIRIYPSGTVHIFSRDYGDVSDTIEENTILTIEPFKEVEDDYI